MCGIYGISVRPTSWCNGAVLQKMVTRLAILSESRGKEAAGFAMLSEGKIVIDKAPETASKLLKTDVFKAHVLRPIKTGNVHTIIGHSRLVTDGYERNNRNNQPVARDNLVCVHNGIVVNIQRLWKQYSHFRKQSELDSEIIPVLLRHHFSGTGSLKVAVQKTFQEIYGMASIGILFCDYDNLLLATNNGSLYYLSSEDKNVFIFASERFILKSLIGSMRLEKHFDAGKIVHLEANSALLVDLASGEFERREFNGEKEFECLHGSAASRSIRDLSKDMALVEKEKSSFEIYQAKYREFEDHAAKFEIKIKQLKRCSKCVLPETFPFIQFDAEGICNYCNSNEKLIIKGEEELARAVVPLRRADGRDECLVSFSGGRDSSFALHYIKIRLGLKPVAFSYDWGMITDLARRNQSRLCGKLGVEHILVSADIRKKRANIRKNILAWLHRPHLGMVPIFMAGDKQYYYYAEKIKKQNDLGSVIMAENPLEKTGFKTTFSGAKQSSAGVMAYHLNAVNKYRIGKFYLSQYLSNFRYINSSLIDTLGAFLLFYGLPHNYLNIFDYIRWDESDIVRLLTSEYDWETEPGYSSTWRIGDGTAPFYNYIYYAVAGFTENDTFRSNQIREGMISRAEAMNKVQLENQPRWEAIQWYCDTIGIDMKTVLRKINKIHTLYEIAEKTANL